MGDNKLQLDQRIEINVETGPYQGTYHSNIAQIEDSCIKIISPFNRGEIVPLRIGLPLTIYYTGSYAAYCFETEIISREKNNEPLLVINPPENIQRIQRRDYFRMDAKEKVKYRLLGTDNEYKETNTVDISGGGLAIAVDEEIKEESLLELYLDLPDLKTTKLKGKVMNRFSLTDGQAVGLLFVDIDDSTRDKIIQWLFDYQRKLRRKGLL